jgi:hypothetical protein
MTVKGICGNRTPRLLDSYQSIETLVFLALY